jgi:hypothetical protein
MKDSSFLNSSSLYIEISQTTLKALKDDSGLEIALERQANGMWSPRCKEQVIGALRKFVDRKQWQPRLRAMCAIGAAGVSLRRLSLPASSKDDFERLLSLQIEAEFPLAPDQLAWGSMRIAPAGGAGSEAKQDILVAAVKKEVVEDYSAVLTACGLNPVFTLAALARTQLVPDPIASGSILEIGPSHSELLTFQDGIPLSVRVLSWGMVNLFQSPSGLELLAKSILANSAGPKLYITGPEDGVKNLASQLGHRLGDRIQCHPIELSPGPGRSAAIAGLKNGAKEDGGPTPLILHARSRAGNGSFSLSRPAPGKWLKPAAILLAAVLVLPYAEAILLKPFLSRKLASLKADKARLPAIDKEMVFLQSLKQAQSPYLDALYIFAKASPSGSRIESLSMSRRGDVSLRATLQNFQQVIDFRSKLIDSGFFSAVALEEQVPSPDRQKLRVRFSAQWKSPQLRTALHYGPTTEEIEKAKNPPAEPQAGGAPPGRMPVEGPPMPPRITKP